MLWNATGIRGLRIHARDGELGSVHDIFFDDHDWTVRYLVADTGWLFGRRVLLPREALGSPDAAAKHVTVALLKHEVKDSPSVEADRPVSRQQEAQLYQHYGAYYGWGPYWGPAAIPGAAAAGPAGAYAPRPARQEGGTAALERERGQEGDVHLRSVREVTGYYVEARDGEIGHVEEFLIEPDGWNVRFLVVDTRNWLPGKKVIISPQWLESVSWTDRQVRCGLSREQIKASPEYNPQATVDRAYEQALYGHYGRQPYWA